MKLKVKTLFKNIIKYTIKWFVILGLIAFVITLWKNFDVETPRIQRDEYVLDNFLKLKENDDAIKWLNFYFKKKDSKFVFIYKIEANKYQKKYGDFYIYNNDLLLDYIEIEEIKKDLSKRVIHGKLIR